MDNNDISQYAPYLSFPWLVSYMIIYFIAEVLARRIYQRLYPDQYEDLQQQGKEVRTFVFAAGFFITLFISTPACLSAATEEITGPYSQSLSSSAQICLASRTTLWLSELPRLSYSPQYTLHHLGALAHLLYHTSSSLSPLLLYVLYASLLNEVFSDTGCLLSIHGLKLHNSRAARVIQAGNLAGWMLLRVPAAGWAVIEVARMYARGDSGVWIAGGMVGVYVWFVVGMVEREMVKFWDARTLVKVMSSDELPK